ncbi:peptidylprolyl isomerase [Plantactinospora siamensis]|uniref:peptidylprolyl isomerase n=1 Tax=Plantactinospora siamensis TaxID=555372 RepID=A0ABV6P3A8_9ACTN
MTSTRERQRAAAKARLEKEMRERAEQARRRRRTRNLVAGGAVLLLVVAGGVWAIVALNDDSGKKNTAANAGTAQCTWTPLPAQAKTPQIKDVGVPPTSVPKTGTDVMTIDTGLGPIKAKVDRAATPCTAASFEYLASKNFWNNTKCHRLVTQGIQVLQCGDPSATGKGYRQTDGQGGPGYQYAEENLPTDKRPAYPAGVIAMAKTQAPNSTGSQFFIVYGDSQLDPSYTVLGTITQGMDLVQQVAKAGDDGAFAAQAGGGHPKKEVLIKSITMAQS